MTWASANGRKWKAARRRAAAWLSLVLWLCGSSARADSVLVRRAAFEERAGALTISVRFDELFEPRMVKRLKSGFPTSVVMRVFIYTKAGGEPIVVQARTLHAVYDLWDEVYLVNIEERGAKRQLRFKKQEQAHRELTQLSRFPLLEIKRVALQEFYFAAIIVEVNPMRPEVLAEVQRWLRTPYRRHQQVGGESFFGSFVSIFVNNKVRRAEKTLKLRTQLFYRQP
jgi:hypothetical protein